jgi:hypothetical protein
MCKSDDLYEAFNTHTTETIRVNRAALEDACSCHLKFDDAFKPSELLARPPRTGSTTVEVNRAKLFEFLKDHSTKRCDVNT